MSDAKPDELVKQLKETLARRRFRPMPIVLGVLALSVVILAGLAYFLHTGPRQAPLQVLAFDAVVVEEEAPVARVQIYSVEPESPITSLRRKTVVVQEPRRVNQIDEKPRMVTLKSDDSGQVSIEWPIGKHPIGEFLASYIDVEKQHASVNDRGMIFVWPKDAPIMIVVDETLIGEALDADAGATLTKAAAEGWRIVYVCFDQIGPAGFALNRQWLRRQPKLPRGPVLTPRKLLESPASADSRREVFAELHQRFTGPKLAIVKTASNARITQDVGLPTAIIGQADNVAGILNVASWADVPVKLK